MAQTCMQQLQNGRVSYPYGPDVHATVAKVDLSSTFVMLHAPVMPPNNVGPNVGPNVARKVEACVRAFK